MIQSCFLGVKELDDIQDASVKRLDKEIISPGGMSGNDPQSNYDIFGKSKYNESNLNPRRYPTRQGVR